MMIKVHFPFDHRGREFHEPQPGWLEHSEILGIIPMPHKHDPSRIFTAVVVYSETSSAGRATIGPVLESPEDVFRAKAIAEGVDVPGWALDPQGVLVPASEIPNKELVSTKDRSL